MFQNLLTNLQIKKVSFVPAGANDEAHIKIVKSKPNPEGGKCMNFEEILAQLSPEHAEVVKAHVATLEKAKTDAEATSETMKKEAEDAKAALEAKEKEAEINKGVSEEDILKNADPAVAAIVQKLKEQAAANAAVVAKMNEERIQSEAVAKAATINKLGLSQDDLVGLYKSLNSKDTNLCNQVFGFLTQAQSMVEKGGVFKEIGTSIDGAPAGDTAAAWAKIEKAAEELVAKGTKKEIAIAQVLKENTELYKEYADTLK